MSFTNDKKNAKELSSKNKYVHDILGKNEDLFLRVYILDGILSYVDEDCDPYIKVKIGKSKMSTRNDHLVKTKIIDFYKGFEIPIQLPGPSKLSIEIWDYDGIGDDFIGKTVIDIEDRYYSSNWRNKKWKLDENGKPTNKVPIEYRSLWSDISPISQGMYVSTTALCMCILVI